MLPDRGERQQKVKETAKEEEHYVKRVIYCLYRYD